MILKILAREALGSVSYNGRGQVAVSHNWCGLVCCSEVIHHSDALQNIGSEVNTH